MYFRTYNHETGSNNGGTARGSILEEIDEELAALLDDEDLGIKKKKKKGGAAEPLASDAMEDKESPKEVAFNYGKGGCNNHTNTGP
jgi:hypothetical protein